MPETEEVDALPVDLAPRADKVFIRMDILDLAHEQLLGPEAIEDLAHRG